MTKPKTKLKAATRSSARKTSKPKSRVRLAPARPAAGPDTKHARIIAMLRTPAGATIASLVTATEWQQEWVRAFLSGEVRKKLRRHLVFRHTVKGRGSRLRVGQASPAAGAR